mgnify:CR=1 FL=1
MRILNAGDKCTQLDLNSKLIGDFIFNNKCFFHSLRKGRQVLKRKITVPQIHIYTLIAIIQKVTQYYISKRYRERESIYNNRRC